jgi:hypothetical protein
VHHGQTRQTVLADPAPPRIGEVPWDPVVTTLAGVTAAWMAAGSVGLLAHPLQRALTLLLLGVAVLVQRTIPRARTATDVARLLLVLSAVAYMIALPLPAANIMSVAVLLALFASTSTGQGKSILLASSTAVAVFGLYRFAVASIPWLWLAVHSVGRGLGDTAGLVTGRPLWIGATFAGIDFLVLTGVFWGLYLPYTAPPRTGRAIYGLAGILGGHLVYLVLLSYVPDLLTAAGPLPAGDTGGATYLRLLHLAVPWNLPAVACGIHLLIIAAMLRWPSWPSGASKQSAPDHAIDPRSLEAVIAHRETVTLGAGALATALRHARQTLGKLPLAAATWRSWMYSVHVNKRLTTPAARFGVVALVAILLPVISVFHRGSPGLTGKRIVFYEKGFLNWLKPVHDSYGRLSSGMYGMLPVFLESLGAKSLISADLSEADLQDADVLVLIFPDDPWQEGQLPRIHDFVARGGSLLVLGEHTTRGENGHSRFNEVLAPTALQVRFDSATFAVGGWLQSYEALSHPTTVGIADDQNQFGVVIGASLEARWPARPILVGQWGWADPGDEASSRAMMGNDRYDAGEKLGDLVLAAEQPLGQGRIVALGDTSGLTNAINVSSYVFTRRLFAYLAGGGHTHPAWRQLAAVLASALLAGLLCRRPEAWKTSLAALALTASLAAGTAVGQTDRNLLPDGRRQNPNNLAYIDAAHVGAYSHESWRPDGIGGLALTLMRNGYLTLALPTLNSERLARAGLFISIAPLRPFAPAEIRAVKTFVNDGGTFILMVGHDESAPSATLLSAFGLRVGMPQNKALEPEPFGHFKSPYMESEGKRVYVRFHAAWPVAADDPNAHVFAYGRDDRPVMIMRRFGKGAVVLIGDTCFATNQNLEREDGSPFEGLRENADFWRWFLTVLRREPMWVPPLLRSSPTHAAQGESSKEAQP